jgi:hypothetical protein
MANSGGGNTTQTNVLVNIGVQGQQAVTQAQQQVQQLNSTSQAGAQINMGAPVRTLRQELRLALAEAQRLANSGQQNTAAFQQAGTRVQALRNAIEDSNRSIRNFDPENKFRVFASAAGLAAKSVQGYTAALQFAGVDSASATESIAKLQQVMAFADAIDSLKDLKDVWGDMLRVLGLTTTQAVAQTTAQNALNASTVTQATVTQGATLATKGLGLAFKTLGIGLLIAAVAYLVENWDSLKKSITGLLPDIGNVSSGFDKIKQVFSGIGSVIVNVLLHPLDLLSGYFKTLYKLITLDFQGAFDNIKNGILNLANFYNTGVANKLASQRAEQRKEELTKEVEHLKERIEILKAGGKDITRLQEKLYKDQLELAKGNEDQLKKLRQERAVAEATEQKKKEDEAKALAKKKAEEAKAKHKADLELLKKNNEAIVAFDNEVQAAYLTAYEKREAEINKKADSLLKLATPQQRASIEQDRAFQLNQVRSEATASTANNAAQTNLVESENANRPNENDTPEQATAKINNLAKAKFDAENAAFILKKTQLEGQQEEIALLTAQHQKTLTDDEEANAKARKEIAEAEKKAKLATYEQIGAAIAVAGQIAGENTVAGKALAVASTTIETYLSAQKAYASQLIPGDPTSPFRAALAAGVAVATGLQNVRKIVSVKVPGANGGGGSGSPSITPPVINSTVINRDNNGVNEIRDTLDNQNKKQEPIRAYIVDKDLENQKSKIAYYNSQSTI